jgi:hypothetical protein
MANGTVDLGLRDIEVKNPNENHPELTAGGNTGVQNLGLNEVTMTPRFVVVVDGQTLTQPLATRAIAESFVMALPEDQRAAAQIVPATADGQTVLLG